jgi:hypothetical protein
LRKRLYGKDATDGDFAGELVRLRFGDHKKHQQPLNYSEIAQRLGVSRMQAYRYRAFAIKHGFLEVKDGKDVLPEATQKAKEFSRFETDSFAQDPLVADWITDMRTRKGGKGIKGWKNNFAALKRLCNTIKVNPEQLITDKKTYETILKNLKIELDKGNFDGEQSKRGALIFQNNEMTFHTMVMASRGFVQYHGVSLPRGTDGIASGKLIGHGKYADIHLTFDEIHEAKKYITDKWGIDSDIFRIFFFGIETCARYSAIINAPLTWTRITSPDNEVTFVMEVIETKAEHINEGRWKKYIKTLDLQRSLELAKQKHYIKLHNLSRRQIETTIVNQIREVYTHLGKAEVHQKYFMRKPFHCLRHIGAQLALETYNWNYAIVCKIGGWHTAKELEDSYGEMPEEKFLQLLSTIKTPK